MNSSKLALAALVLVACGPSSPPVPPPCGVEHVEATLASVTLAQDCPATATPADKVSARDSAGVCLDGFACTSLCRQSSMQLAFMNNMNTPSSVSIVAVRLKDKANGHLIETLQSRGPKQWSSDKYIIWDQQLAGNASLKATYDLSEPTYGSNAKLWGAPQTYSVEVDVSIDGQIRTLQIDAQREPEVVT